MEGPIELEGKEIEGTSIARRNSKTIRKLLFSLFFFLVLTPNF